MRALLALGALLCSGLVIGPSLACALSFGDITEQLQYLANRDLVLSRNIANSNTPGYLPKDISKSGSNSGAMHLNVTNAMHIPAESLPRYDTYDAAVLELKPNGNGITIENEIAKKSENTFDIKHLASLFAHSENLLQVAISGGAK